MCIGKADGSGLLSGGEDVGDRDEGCGSRAMEGNEESVAY